jgi:hypothetical protein
VLVPGGTLLLVTPDRSTRLLPWQRPWNRWHVHEYGAGELSSLMSRHFAHVDVLGMTAKREMIQVELRRCQRVKWAMLPLTLPVFPDSWRIAGLNAVHRLRSRQSRPQTSAKPYPFVVEDVTISKGASPSVNLVAIAS